MCLLHLQLQLFKRPSLLVVIIVGFSILGNMFPPRRQERSFSQRRAGLAVQRSASWTGKGHSFFVICSKAAVSVPFAVQTHYDSTTTHVQRSCKNERRSELYIGVAAPEPWDDAQRADDGRETTYPAYVVGPETRKSNP